ncbi:2-dehydropantoate 2-reductase [Bradyrhizobium sp. CCGB12]|uniref:ketopantoate reductase family protein n=1 Tax=Bradyrhizobium sp. CCGB12 TaxID=2949632 RepID=UPI0020B3EC03|nr:2-dehydropantoate 2-reductase [Bradyrhizobium sp. CCGB12]MCP3387783.1 2-dehydropantoate 2-reductase [Bradyrhizobium sp. CCGB12]
MAESIGIVGPGAIGLLLAHHLRRAGRDVTILARPTAVDQLSRDGIELFGADGRGSRQRVKVAAVQGADGFDLLILALKGHQLTTSARELEHLLESSRVVMTAMNGVPWWLPHGSAKAPRQLEAVDEQGLLSALVDTAKVVGAVVNIGARTERAGVVHHVFGSSLSVGPAIPSEIERASAVLRVFAGSGITVELDPNIRKSLWLKLLNNAALNPVSVVTGWTLRDILGNSAARAVAAEIMEEVAAVGRALKIIQEVDVEARLAYSATFGAFKTSMLQDFEAGRTLETASLCDAVVELAKHANVPVPTLTGIIALVRARCLGNDIPGANAVACLLGHR